MDVDSHVLLRGQEKNLLVLTPAQFLDSQNAKLFELIKELISHPVLKSG